MKYFIFFLFLFVQIQAQTIGNVRISKAERNSYRHHDVEELTRNTDPNIDVQRYTLHFTVTPGENEIQGKSITQFTAVTSTNEVKLDAKSNISISSVTFEGNSVNFTHENNLVTITLPQNVNQGESASITVNYVANIANVEGIYNDSHNNKPEVYTLSEPFFASYWWVGKDDLSDKANGVDVYITHPSTMKGTSNGLLISTTDNENGTTTSHWEHNYKIPAYLVSLAIRDYTLYQNTATLGNVTLPIDHYVYTEDLNADLQAQLDKTPTYVEFMSSLVSEYPYINEKYGHSQAQIAGGMEHTTNSTMGGWDDELLAHELVHQWFGNKITCGSWQDIWLNEGFATYFEGLIRHNQNGDDFFNQWKSMHSFFALDPEGSVFVPEDEINDVERIFSADLTYSKGAMVLHMLRYKIGDEAFFNGVQSYINDPELAFNFAVTSDLKQHMETASGIDLQEFFADWIYAKGYPIFSLNFSQGGIQNGVLNVSQRASIDDTVFETPFEVTFTGANNEQVTKRFDMTAASQSFEVTDLGFEVTSYMFNPKSDILGEVERQTLAVNSVVTDNVKTSIYPNPVKNVFTIKAVKPFTAIEIYNIEGQLVFNDNFNAVSKKEFEAQQLTTGVYMIKLKSTNNQSFFLKMVKE